MDKIARLLCLLLLPLCGGLAPVVAAESTRGVARVQGAAVAGPLLSEHYSNSYALLIGVDQYEHSGWDRLPSVPSELASVKGMLEKQGFEVETLSNLTGRELMNSLTDFVADKGYDENNRLLVFFSGHGETIQLSAGRQMGYFVPADAPPYAVDNRGFITRALSMNRVMAMAKEIRSKHALFVFDSCFSGSIFQSRSFASNGRSLERLLSKPVRYFITSGSANETVPSDSAFTRAFVDSFESGAADLNRDGYVTSTELGLHLTQNVRLGEQTPQHGKINNYELSQGDLVFASLGQPVTGTDATDLANEARMQDFRLRAELLYWESLQAARSVAGYEGYLSKYPDGQFNILARQELLTLKARPQVAQAAEPMEATVRVGMAPTKMIVTSVHWAGDWNSESAVALSVERAMRQRLENRGVESQALLTERSSGSWVKRRRSTYGIDRRVFEHMTDEGQGMMGVVVRMRDDNSKGELQFVFSSSSPERISKRYYFSSDYSLKRAINQALDKVLEPELDIVMR